MLLEALEQDLQAQVGQGVRLSDRGEGRFRVYTPFHFDDGDHLSIVLRQEGNRWVLSDGAHTFMHLSYSIDEEDLERGRRREVIERALATFGLEDRDGELVLPVEEDRYGDALYDFVQGLLRIADVTYLSRPRARSSAFGADFQELLTQATPNGRIFGWHDDKRDPEGEYSVDCRIDAASSRPLFVYALAGNARTRDATISLHTFRSWGLDFHPLAIFENRESIGRGVLSRLGAVCKGQFSCLATDAKEIRQFLREYR